MPHCPAWEKLEGDVHLNSPPPCKVGQPAGICSQRHGHGRHPENDSPTFDWRFSFFEKPSKTPPFSSLTENSPCQISRAPLGNHPGITVLWVSSSLHCSLKVNVPRITPTLTDNLLPTSLPTIASISPELQQCCKERKLLLLLLVLLRLRPNGTL